MVSLLLIHGNQNVGKHISINRIRFMLPSALFLKTGVKLFIQATLLNTGNFIVI